MKLSWGSAVGGAVDSILGEQPANITCLAPVQSAQREVPTVELITSHYSHVNCEFFYVFGYSIRIVTDCCGCCVKPRVLTTPELICHCLSQHLILNSCIDIKSIIVNSGAKKKKKGFRGTVKSTTSAEIRSVISPAAMKQKLFFKYFHFLSTKVLPSCRDGVIKVSWVLESKLSVKVFL